MDYADFIRAKVKLDSCMGFDATDIHPALKPHQQDIVQWAVRGGRRAIFASFGLGKTLMQLECLRQIQNREQGRQLIIAPLGVRQEFKHDVAEHLGGTIQFVQKDDQISGNGLYITNYESVREGKIDVNQFNGISLDEASVLRSYGSKTFQEFLTIFDQVKYRFVATATPSPNRFKELIHYAGFLGIMDTGQALAQPITAKVLTPSGWTTMGQIAPGDYVISAKGLPTKVLSTHPQGEKDVYRVRFSDNSKTECTLEHLWETQTQYQRNAHTKYCQRNGINGKRNDEYFTVKTTEEIISTLVCGSTGSKNHSIPVVSPVQFAEKGTLFDPYVMGLVLGDGHIRQTSVTLTTADNWIFHEAKKILSGYGLLIYKSEHKRKDGQENHQYYISTTGKQGGSGYGANQLLFACQKYELCGKRAWEKHIPDDYKFNSVDVRLSMLQGLMDTDGTISNNKKARTPKFITTSEQLAKDVQEICRSLGGIANIHNRRGVTPTGGNGRKQYHVSIMLPNGMSPFRMPRKADLVLERKKYNPARYIQKIEKVGRSECVCIAVEDDRHLYVTDDYILTHNTRFFKRDSTKANNLTLYPHMAEKFWFWVSSWAIFLQKPSDLGHSDDGYVLPPLHVHYHKVEAETGPTLDRKGQMLMFPDASLSLKDAAKEKRESMDERVEQIREIVRDIDGQMVIWATQNGEQQAIERMLKSEGITYSSLYGHQNIDSREALLMDWKSGKTRVFLSKPTMYGAGVNMQQCNQMIFAGIDYKFYDMIQSIHRIYRFLQERPCHVHIIYTQTESEIMKTLNEKWDNHNRMVQKMTDIIKKYGLSHIKMEQALTRKIDIERRVESGEGWTAVNNDCVDETRRMEADSVGLIHTSIPFSNHYEYTPSCFDFGYTNNNDHFWGQMDYLTPELYRILQPGRIYACHVKDRILFGNATGKGAPTVSPFHAECIFHGMKHGFDYMGLITVVTDVVRENNQTYRLGWTEQCKDGTKMGAGSPEYIVIFRKPQTDRTKGYADVPVEKSKDEYSRSRWQIDAHAFWRSDGDRFLKPEEMATYPADVIYRVFREYSSQNLYDYDHHVKIGEVLDEKGSLPATFMSLAPVSHHPEVWTDINRMRTLNSEQARRNLNMHICPLQHDIVDRIITRFTNKDDLIFDPFGGLMTVPVRAIRLGRRGYASELNPDYWKDGLRYLRNEEQRLNNPTLFDFEKEAI